MRAGWSLVVVVILVAPGAARADDLGAPQDVVRYRQAVMKALSAHLKALAPLAAKKVNLPKHVEQHARAVVELSRQLGELFPRGTGPGTGVTDAKEAIWSDPKTFQAALSTMQDSADALGRAAQAGVAFKTELDAAGDACGSCHKAFRKKQ